MRAVILAAGRGSRLGPLTEGRPKCLVKLADTPLVELQTNALRRGGVSEIGIVCGYQAQMLRLPDVTYFHNSRWSETNMVTSLLTAADWLLSEPTIISYGDIFYPHVLVRDLIQTTGDIVIAFDRQWRSLWSRRFIDPLVDAETFRTNGSGRLLEIGGKTCNIEEITGQYIGLFKLTPTAWRAIETLLQTMGSVARDRLDMTGLFSALLRRDFPIQTLGTDRPWGEVDTLGDLALYEDMIESGDLTLER
jgi:L-glutamine-phosphate cytidylyltransferase